jgi:proton-dependent oligopeptide transporter, POT family
MATNNQVGVTKHPKGLYVLFATEMWERFSFYSMLALFTLYLQNPDEGFGWSAAQATGLYANYLMFVYASPLIGGWLADKKLGYRRAVMIGGLFFMAGHGLLSIRSMPAVYAALTCLVIGNGLFKPNVSTMVGNLYPEGSHLKDRAYNIFYMGINIGAAAAPIVMEIVKRSVGNHPAFAVAAFGMVISVFILWKFQKYVDEPKRGAILDQPVGDVAPVTTDAPPEGVSQQGAPEEERTATTPGGMFARASAARASVMDAVPESKRVFALLVIFAIVIVFWMVFHQNGSTLTYWANDNTEWTFSGTISNAINPLWVVTLTFPLVWFWKFLDGRGKEPATPTKMAIGMTLTGLSFFILFAAARMGENTTPNEAMYASGAFRITERSLNNLRTEGVPNDVVAKLGAKAVPEDVITRLQTEGVPEGVLAKARTEVVDDKYDVENYSQALERSIKNLKAAGVPETVVQKLEKLKDYKGENPSVINTVLHWLSIRQPKFDEALRKATEELRAEGVNNEVLLKLEQEGKRRTGHERLMLALNQHLGEQQTAQYAPSIMRQSYLFRVSWLWLILAYGVVTLGELMLSPMGLSLVSKVAPIRMRGMLMGGWFVATAIGNKLTMIGIYWDQWWQSTFFAVLGACALVMAVVLVLLLKPLKKAMPGV